MYDLITVFHLLASVLFLPLQTPKFVDEELFKKKRGGGGAFQKWGKNIR